MTLSSLMCYHSDSEAEEVEPPEVPTGDQALIDALPEEVGALADVVAGRYADEDEQMEDGETLDSLLADVMALPVDEEGLEGQMIPAHEVLPEDADLLPHEEIQLHLQLWQTSELGQPAQLVELGKDGVKYLEPPAGGHTPAVQGHQLPDIPGIKLQLHAPTPSRSARWQAWYPKEHGQNTQTVHHYI